MHLHCPHDSGVPYRQQESATIRSISHLLRPSPTRGGTPGLTIWRLKPLERRGTSGGGCREAQRSRWRDQRGVVRGSGSARKHKKRSWRDDPSSYHDLYPETGRNASRPPDITVSLVSAWEEGRLKTILTFVPILTGSTWNRASLSRRFADKDDGPTRLANRPVLHSTRSVRPSLPS